MFMLARGRAPVCVVPIWPQLTSVRTPKTPTGYALSGWFSPDFACSVSGGP